MCVTAFCRRWLVPRWAGPRPPRTPSPSSPSTCCLDSQTWVLSVTSVVILTVPSCHFSFKEKANWKTPVAPFITLQVEEFLSWRKSACVELFSSTQMHERAAHTFPNISPLMQRAMTFSTQPGGQGGWGWWGADALVFLAHVSAPGACEGWRWRERAAAKCKPQKRVNVSGRAEGWRLVYAGTSWYAPWLYDVCTHSPCLSQCSIHDVAAPCSTKHFLTPLR